MISFFMFVGQGRDGGDFPLVASESNVAHQAPYLGEASQPSAHWLLS